MMNKTQLLETINALPPSQFVIGQQLGDTCAIAQSNFALYVDALRSTSGKTPAVVGVFLTGRMGTESVATMTALVDFLSGKGVSVVQGYYEPNNLVGFCYPTMQTITTNPTFLADLDKLVSILRIFEQHGIIVLLNPFCEHTYQHKDVPSADGVRWWYVGGASAASFVAMWRFVHDYVASRVGNVLFVFEPAPNGYWEDVTKGYPGPSYVDIVGVSAYADVMKLREPGDTATGYSGRGLVTWYKLRVLGHPIGFSQTGPDTRNGTWSNLAYTEGASFFQGCKFIFPWSSWSSQTVKVAIVHNRNAIELMQSPLVVTRESLAQMGGDIMDVVQNLTAIETALRSRAVALGNDAAALSAQADAVAQTIVQLQAIDAELNAAADAIKIG